MLYAKQAMTNENQETSGFPLPEGCIADIVSFTSPADACRVAAVSLGLKSAAESDVVWEGFLPSDYEHLISRSVSPVVYSTKKELYFLLSDSPLLIDGGKLSFWISKRSGKKCYMLCARELQIAWKDAPVYWNWTSLPESRFSEVAELLSVCWLDIRGILEARALSPETNYAAYLVFKLSEGHYGLHNFAKASVRFVRDNTIDEIEGETSSSTNVCIVPETRRNEVRGSNGRRIPERRPDGWMEIELGEFFINGEGDMGHIRMEFRETEHMNWKKGLIVEGIEIRPK